MSHLGQTFTAKGYLDTDGDLQIDGQVFGRICADRLVVGAGGYVNGDVIARDVLIVGRLEGRIFALNVALFGGSHRPHLSSRSYGRQRGAHRRAHAVAAAELF